MFPFRHSSIFRSRWMALLWAGGIIWTAIDVAGPPEPKDNEAQQTDASGAPIDKAQMKQIQNLLKDLPH